MDRWTIAEPRADRFRMHINTGGGRPLWCSFDYEVAPAPALDGVEVVAGPQADAVTVRWLPHLKRGIESGSAVLRERDGRLLTGVRVVIMKVYAHPIDTTAEACERYGCSFIVDLGRERAVRQVASASAVPDPVNASLASIRHGHDLAQLARFAAERHGFGDSDGGFGITYPSDLDEYERAPPVRVLQDHHVTELVGERPLVRRRRVGESDEQDVLVRRAAPDVHRAGGALVEDALEGDAARAGRRRAADPPEEFEEEGQGDDPADDRTDDADRLLERVHGRPPLCCRASRAGRSGDRHGRGGREGIRLRPAFKTIRGAISRAAGRAPSAYAADRASHGTKRAAPGGCVILPSDRGPEKAQPAIPR
ncbi:MAG TPA: hypothetical protein VEA69_08070 [Tepidisphaeraceae bacterium]|nr:hypothetical protein [Tepidisphaeraceae bacterium]